MSRTITLDEAQANLIDIVHRLEPGEEIIITENGKPVATLIGMKSSNESQESPATPGG
jgi:prevent-host-death family protein